MNKRIHILGGGLLGRLMALHLVRAGHCVHIYDKGDAEGREAAAYVAAAMLAPMAEAVDATAEVIALGYQSIDLWQDLLPTLPEKVFMQRSGSLIVWHPQDDDLSRQFARDLRHAHHNQQTWIDWREDDIATHEPQLAQRFARGFYLPSEGQLHAREALHALAVALHREGVECHWHCAREVEDILENADYVVDCRGFGAKTAWNAQAQNSRLRGIRGEVALVHAPEITLNRPVRLLHPRYPLYIAPKENHIFVIGATQIESEDLSEVSVRSGLELMSALYAVHSAFGEARILELQSQLRPTLQDHNPHIVYQSQQRIMSVNGLFRHGFMISPAVSIAAVRLLQALINGKQPSVDDISGLRLEIQAA